jgi:hypothetical protein
MKADADRAGRWHDVPVNLRPLMITRLANLFGSVVLVILGVGIWLEKDVRLALLLSVLGLWLTARAYGIGVQADEQSIRVKGLLWSRTIPIDRIKRITTFPAISWTAPSGRTRWTPIYAFTEFGRPIRRVQDRNTLTTEQLQEWVGRER